MALLALSVVFVSAAQAASPTQILKDCYADSSLQGNYSTAELRAAQKQLPTDVDEYSDCRDVISRAISANAAATRRSNAPTGASPSGGGGGGGSSSSGGGNGGNGATTGGASAPTATPTPAPTRDSGSETPATPREWQAVTEASTKGDRAVRINGRPVSPGATRLTAEVGRNSVPTTLVVVFALLAAAALAAGVPLLKRRVLTHQQT